MCSWFVSRGHSVDVIAGLPHYPEWEIHQEYKNKGFYTEAIDGVNILRVPHFVPPADRVNAKTRIKLETSFHLKSLRYALPILFKKKKYDAVIAVCPPMQSGLFPMIYKIFRNVPWIFHVQDLQVDAALNLGILKNHTIIRKMLFGIEKMLFKNATKVSTITDAMKQKIINKGIDPNKMVLFPNWADLDFIKPMDRNNPLRKEFGYTEDDTVIMYAGNMGEKQGLEIIIDAACHFTQDSNIQFAMVGDGTAKKRLTKLTRDKGLTNLHFFPLQPLQKLPNLLAMADIHLVIQKREACDLVMPSKLTNILAAGRPIIATAKYGSHLYQVIVENQCGLVLKSHRTVELIEGIKNLTNQALMVEQMGQKSRFYAINYFDKEKILQEMVYNINRIMT